MRRILYWTLFGLTFAVYGVMLSWSLPTVSSAAGGLAPFDMRPSGYSFAEAHAFLRALSAEGTQFYRGVQQRLDFAYPAMMGLTLFFALTALLPRRLGRWRFLLAAPALITAAFDYAENHAVATMLSAGADGLTAAMAGEASRWSVLKAGSTTVVMSTLLVLLLAHGVRLAMRLWRRRRAHLVARWPLTVFLVLAFALTWTVQYCAIAAGLSFFVASALGTTLGLTLPALLLTAAVGGRTAVTALLWRLVPRRDTIVWIAVAGFGLPAATLALAVGTSGYGPALALARTWPGLLTQYLPAMLLTLVAIQLAEELGWTGFLQQRLQERHGPLAASLMVAPLFAGSHLMLNLLGAGAIGPALAMLAVQLAFAVAFRLVIGWLYNRADGSVLVAALFHAGFNTMNGPFVVGVVGDAAAQWLPLALIVAAGLAIGVAALARRLPWRGATSLVPSP